MSETISLIRMPSAEAILLKMCEGMGLSESEARESTVTGLDEDGRAHDIQFYEELASISAMGLWGFSDTPSRTIYVWRDAGHTDDGEYANLLGHELGHFTTVKDDGDPELIDEMIACSYGSVAEQVHRWMVQE